jgi:hypothetical protein
MFSRMLCSAATIFPAGKEPGLAAGCRRDGARRTAFAFQTNLGARRAAGPFLSTDRGACGNPDWEADVAAHAGRAAVRGGVEKIPREARNR